MTAFFSLGTPGSSGSNSHQQNYASNEQDNNHNHQIYPTSAKGLEIWQQYVQVHHHHHALPKLHLHHYHHHNQQTTDEWRSPSLSLGGFRAGGGEREGMNCQDCGNQAKKDCAHLRCRTCCKSRGFDCPTHVKSTWVPAAKRRERQQQQLAAVQGGVLPELDMMREKRMRETRGDGGGDVAGFNCTTTIPATGLEVGNFPAEVNSAALFRCVKVSAMDDPDEQFAYQTAVNIGGHLFKGILYDQGPESGYPEASSGGGATHHHHNIMFTAAGTVADSGAPVTASLLYPNAIYPPPPINAFMAGTQFFPPPRS